MKNEKKPMFHAVVKEALLEFSNGFPSVAKTEVNDAVQAVYVFTKEKFGLPDGFFAGMELRYELKVSRIDDVSPETGVRICFVKKHY